VGGAAALGGAILFLVLPGALRMETSFALPAWRPVSSSELAAFRLGGAVAAP
jgi:hypothetical protein